MGDALAFMRWELSSLVESFPVGLHLVGDNAYSNSNTLLTPFTRPQTASQSNATRLYRDSFNFHLSQLRIRVEMAFGLLVNKWRVFKAPLRVGVKSIKKVVHVACMLHNFCITERLCESHNKDVDDDADMAATLESKPVPDITDLTVGANDASAYRAMYASTQVYPEPTSESELLRNGYVDKLRQMKRLRPAYNIRRAERERTSELL
ncbi:DDE superfamily endonuclease [Phytophthora infestans]|uniref:DDE superfamily endonuclease n=1 Tax=Phytophthora infestans TaxID=4787 RepID=A0A8S9UNL4_PHYIN|nr:DDE superfamily endonuclease [Phytophthora infestans]